jgi:hypothetical protein
VKPTDARLRLRVEISGRTSTCLSGGPRRGSVQAAAAIECGRAAAVTISGPLGPAADRGRLQAVRVAAAAIEVDRISG